MWNRHSQTTKRLFSLLLLVSLWPTAPQVQAQPGKAGMGTVQFLNGPAGNYTNDCYMDIEGRQIGYYPNGDLEGCGVRTPTHFRIYDARSAVKITFYGSSSEHRQCHLSPPEDGNNLFIITLKMRKNPTSSTGILPFNGTFAAALEGKLVDANIEATKVERSGTVPEGNYAKYLYCIRFELGDVPSAPSTSEKE